MIDSTTPEAVALPATESRQPEPERQPGLPIKLDAKRPSERIRARVLHDGRIVGSSFAVAIVLSEHVAYSDGTHSVRCIRQSTIKRWSHCGITAVKAAISDLVALDVLTVDRKRYGMRFVFRIDWLSRWQPESERGRGENPDSRIPAISSETLCGPRSTHSAREGRAAGPSPAQIELAEEFHVEPIPGETGVQLYERIATAKRGSANMSKRRTAERSPWGGSAPSKVLRIQNALKHGKPFVYGTVLADAGWEYDDGLLTLTFTGKPTLARQAAQAASWIEGVVAETLGGECKVVINDA